MNPDDFLLSASGVRMPRIIYGTAWKREKTAGLVEQAIREYGINPDAVEPLHA